MADSDQTSQSSAAGIISRTRLSEPEEIKVGFEGYDPLHIETTEEEDFIVATRNHLYIIPSNERTARDLNGFKSASSSMNCCANSLVYYLKKFKNLLFIFYPGKNAAAIGITSGLEVHSIPYTICGNLPINSRER